MMVQQETGSTRAETQGTIYSVGGGRNEAQVGPIREGSKHTGEPHILIRAVDL